VTLIRKEPELERPVNDVADLIGFFRSGEKPREAWRIGTEHEKLGLRRDTFEPVGYGTEKGLGRLLEILVAEHGFSPLHEGEALVGAERDGKRVTLEPGGQLELSGAPLATLHETCSELRDHIELVNQVSRGLGIVWIGLGLHPFARLEEIEWVPRDRYRIMRDWLGSRGALAHHMMKATGSVQVNLDYLDERDLARKLRVAFAASPVASALYANSSISEGRRNGFLTRREWIWRHTDPDRCGILPFVFDPEWIEGSAYGRYTEWALDVPMLFILRGKRHVPLGGKTFRAFLREGQGDHRATLADWSLHLTTVFPEVRLKRVMEIRSADAVASGLLCALPAVWKGILYDGEALSAAEARLRHWSYPQVDRLHADVCRRGLEAETPDGPVLPLAQELVDLAAKGLRRVGAGSEDESSFLSPLYEVLERGESPARELLARWEGPWGRRMERLVEHVAY
jgi:glutamate--cysteine ligase